MAKRGDGRTATTTAVRAARATKVAKATKGAAVATGERLIRGQTSSLGGGPQVQAPRKGSFDKAKRARFFRRLQETANIRDAARFAGVTEQTVWRWRKTDPTFPRPVQLSPGCVRFKLAELEVWEATRTAA